MYLEFRLFKQLLKNNIKPDIGQSDYESLLLDAIDYYEDNDTKDNLKIIEYILNKIDDSIKYKVVNEHSYTGLIILKLLSYIIPSNKDYKKSSIYINENEIPRYYYNHKIELIINVFSIILKLKLPLTSIIHEYCYNTFDSIIYDILLKNGLSIESGYEFLNKKCIKNDKYYLMKSILDKNKISISKY